MMLSDLKEVTKLLEKIAKKAHQQSLATPSYASTVAGKLVSPIPLTHFPSVKTFYPRPLIPIMAPRRRAGFKATPTPATQQQQQQEKQSKGKTSSNPFIYTPLGKKDSKRKEILWVQGDPAEIAFSIANPLPFELRVENMVSTILVCL